MRNVNKLVLVLFAAAGVMLAGCGSDGTSGGSSRAELLQKAGVESAPAAQQNATAPSTSSGQAPQPQRVEVTRVVPVEVVKEVPVEVVREVVKEVPVYVEVTPQPDIQGFAAPAQSAGGECNTYTALPVTVDDDGTIRGEYLMCAWETAVAYSNGVQP